MWFSIKSPYKGWLEILLFRVSLFWFPSSSSSFFSLLLLILLLLSLSSMINYFSSPSLSKYTVEFWLQLLLFFGGRFWRVGFLFPSMVKYFQHLFPNFLRLKHACKNIDWFSVRNLRNYIFVPMVLVTTSNTFFFFINKC